MSSCTWRKPTAETWRSSLLSLIFLQTTGETDGFNNGMISAWWVVLTELSEELTTTQTRRRLEGFPTANPDHWSVARCGPTKAPTGPQEQSRQQNKDNKISHPSNKDGEVSSRCEKCGEAVNSWKRLSVCGAVTNQDRYTHIHSLTHTSACVSGCWHCSIAAG